MSAYFGELVRGGLAVVRAARAWGVVVKVMNMKLKLMIKMKE